MHTTQEDFCLNNWPLRPWIYEINTWVWLNELSQRYQRPITLANLPGEVLDELAGWGMDAIWLMGVWERSPHGRQLALQNPGLLTEFRRVLPDFNPEDVVGSPYCVREYQVDPQLGGREGLAAARAALHQRGLRLVLDFVPNHVAPDHPWVTQHPEYFITGSANDLKKHPGDFVQISETIYAHGRDPFFPAWPDVVQLNAFSPALRQAMTKVVEQIADQCDAVRCDMAMLLVNRIFAKTWKRRAGKPPASEFWPGLIAQVKQTHPDFQFLAEVYWDMEAELLAQGFDSCYDKRLYDHLLAGDAAALWQHLHNLGNSCEQMTHFIENHDERRAALAFAGRQQGAALTCFSVPGAKLFHEQQFQGWQERLPVFLRRRPAEKTNAACEAFYRQLLNALQTADLRNGEWQLCPSTHTGLLGWGWQGRAGRWLVLVNLSARRTRTRLTLPWNDLAGHTWHLISALDEFRIRRSGSELQQHGLFVDLPAWQARLLKVEKRGKYA
jgi:glycosidase